MFDPFKNFTKRDWLIWLASLAAVTVSNIISGDIDPLTFFAAAIGVTSLIFAAKGNVWSQLLMIVFSILYGIVSWRFRYFGEMITYLGMTLPMAVWSAVTWFRNPSENNSGEVKIRTLSRGQAIILSAVSAAVTAVFYFVLKAFDTPNLLFSTISILTSFVAAALTMLRSSYFAMCYALNDAVLIVLWILASFEDTAYIPVAVNFIVFFFNDMYGFISWKKRENVQTIGS